MVKNNNNKTMPSQPAAGKRSLTPSEEGSLSDSTSSPEEEKTIPFLRRLRDMLVENEDVISFSPGHRTNGQVVLGKIIVHDRLKVESQVLQKYFNHSSFASLRRQLNYFCFVRLGKGRQRESTYVNEGVVELDDILSLKRRPAGPSSTHDIVSSLNAAGCISSSTAAQVIVDDARGRSSPSSATDTTTTTKHRTKRRRLSKQQQQLQLQQPVKAALPPPRSASPENNFISEDEHSSEGKQLVTLDLTTGPAAAHHPDKDILAGCTALLNLAGKVSLVWE